MVNYRLLLTLGIVVLVFTSAFLFVSNSAKKADIREAEMLAGSVYSYLRQVDYICRANVDDFQGLNKCLAELEEELEVVDDLEEKDFEDFDTRNNESGYLILLNDGRAELESSDFVLLKNRDVADEGCAIPGDIGEGYVCKLFFNSPCETGDVLEVQYGGEKAYVKTC